MDNGKTIAGVLVLVGGAGLAYYLYTQQQASSAGVAAADATPLTSDTSTTAGTTAANPYDAGDANGTDIATGAMDPSLYDNGDTNLNMLPNPNMYPQYSTALNGGMPIPLTMKEEEHLANLTNPAYRAAYYARIEERRYRRVHHSKRARRRALRDGYTGVGSYASLDAASNAVPTY